MKIKLDALSWFANSMAKCLSSGLSPQRSLELSGTIVSSRSFRKIIAAAIQGCGQGLPVSEALRGGRRVFPHFFLPLIAAGELGGRQVEAYRLVAEHCRRLKPSLKVVRNTWLYPLICVLFGWTVRTGVFLGFGLYRQAWRFVDDTFIKGAMLAALVWCLFRIRSVREAADWVRLQIPIIRETDIRLSLSLFFATFRLVYAAGGLAVTTMFDLALDTVRNSAVRRDLMKARQVLERHGGFGEAFDQPALIDDALKGTIATSAIAGQLESGLDRVVALATEQLEFTLRLFNQIFQRVVSFEVAMSIVGTLLLCLTYSPGR